MCVRAGVYRISNCIPLILDVGFVLFILLETSICKPPEAHIFPSLKILGRRLCEDFSHAVLLIFLSSPHSFTLPSLRLCASPF